MLAKQDFSGRIRARGRGNAWSWADRAVLVTLKMITRAVRTARGAGIRDGVGFHADTVEGLREAFHEAVEDYIETCAKIGKEPQKAYSGQVMFRVSPDVHRKAALAAELSGKSLNQWAEEVLNRAAG